MQKNFTAGELKLWTSNFEKNEKEPFITKSALIKLTDLEDFVSKIKSQNADSVRIYFVRFQPNDAPTEKNFIDGELAEGCKWLTTPNGFTQASVAIVPAKNFKHDENFIFSADDIIINNRIATLMPGVDNEGTALNPPPSSD